MRLDPERPIAPPPARARAAGPRGGAGPRPGGRGGGRNGHAHIHAQAPSQLSVRDVATTVFSRRASPGDAVTCLIQPCNSQVTQASRRLARARPLLRTGRPRLILDNSRRRRQLGERRRRARVGWGIPNGDGDGRSVCRGNGKRRPRRRLVRRGSRTIAATRSLRERRHAAARRARAC